MFSTKTKLFFAPYLQAKWHVFLYIFRIALFTSFWWVLLSFLLSHISELLIAKHQEKFELLLWGFWVSICCYYFIAWCIRKTGSPVLHSVVWKYLHRRYMPIILTLENNYAETLGSSRIFSIFDRGGRAWKDVLSNVAEQITRICIILIPTGYILFQYSPFVALGTIFVLCCIGFFVYLMQKEIEKSKRAKMEAVTEYDRALIKTVQSRFEILQSRALTQELASLDRKNDSYMTLLRAQISRQLMMYQGVRVLSYVILAGAYWFFGHAYLSGSIPLQSVILIASLIGAVSGILFDVTNTYLGLSDQIHSIEHLWEKIEDAPKTPNIFSGPSYTYKGGTIQFDWVDFSYVSSNPILQSFHYTFESGKKYALIGKSGGGKTTIMKLACGFLKPTKGSIQVDGQDLTIIQLSDFYNHIGYLTQDPQVFDGTIRENLVLGSQESIQESDIHCALEKAEAEFVYTLPNGLDTEIWERWVRLSGGQRQRLAIAKIFLKNPEIILLDEPTSALDSTSEEAISRAFERLFEWKTVLIIAHRLKTVQQVDTILVIEEGWIAEEGTHEKLSQAGGIYARMLAAQIHF